MNAADVREEVAQQVLPVVEAEGETSSKAVEILQEVVAAESEAE